jgi:hypothetical protein
VIALADALMTQPGQLGDAVIATLREHFTGEQIVELTLKVMKYNVQKVMVALGVDFAVAPDAVGDLPWNPGGMFAPASES